MESSRTPFLRSTGAGLCENFDGVVAWFRVKEPRKQQVDLLDSRFMGRTRNEIL